MITAIVAPKSAYEQNKGPRWGKENAELHHTTSSGRTVA